MNKEEITIIAIIFSIFFALALLTFNYGQKELKKECNGTVIGKEESGPGLEIFKNPSKTKN